MEECQRIWIEPNGLRVAGRGKPGGYWEDGGGDDKLGPEKPPLPMPDGLYSPNTVLTAALEAEIERLRGNLRQNQESIDFWWKKANAPGRLKPLLVKLLKPVPSLAVWAGMTATFFWNAVRSMPAEPFGGLELLQGLPIPESALAAAGETVIFLVWTACFRHTIAQAIRREFAAR